MHKVEFMLFISPILFLIFICISVGTAYGNDSDKVREKLFMKYICQGSQFYCHNKNCIERSKYCNGVDECGDNSDEKYCNVGDSCLNFPEYMNCESRNYGHKCIPKIWKCDGFYDCPYEDDENNCDALDASFDQLPISSQIYVARQKAFRWILSKRNNKSRSMKWTSKVPRIATVLHLSNLDFMEKYNFTSEIIYELSLSLLSRLALKKIEDIPTSELATYVNAFLLSCINPRKFYVVDLVKELRKRVDETNSTNPAALLALCNAQEMMTETDILKLIESFWKANAKSRIDTQALIVMALACAQKQNMIDQEDLSELTMELKKKQYRNGTVENIKTTALVMQALFASEAEADEDNFDEKKAIQQILRFQENDGSFGNFINTYYVLPVLNYLSFVNISSAHCSFEPKDESEGLNYLKNQVGEKWNVKFSLWIGDDKVLKRSIALRVPANTSFYGILEYASDVDDKYKFEYNVRKRKPYIFSLSGITDDAESETYWLPYILSNESAGELKPINTSVADIYPKNNDHLVYWYKNDA